MPVRCRQGCPELAELGLDAAHVVGPNAQEMALLLKEKDILVGVVGERSFRLVTHYWIDDTAVQQAVATFSAILSEKA